MMEGRAEVPLVENLGIYVFDIVRDGVDGWMEGFGH